MRAHAVKPSATYVNCPGRTVRQLHEEAALHEALRSYLTIHLTILIKLRSAGVSRTRRRNCVHLLFKKIGQADAYLCQPALPFGRGAGRHSRLAASDYAISRRGNQGLRSGPSHYRRGAHLLFREFAPP
jgi:hypothetical protein